MVVVCFLFLFQLFFSFLKIARPTSDLPEHFGVRPVHGGVGDRAHHWREHVKGGVILELDVRRFLRNFSAFPHHDLVQLVGLVVQCDYMFVVQHLGVYVLQFLPQLVKVFAFVGENLDLSCFQLVPNLPQCLLEEQLFLSEVFNIFFYHSP